MTPSLSLRLDHLVYATPDLERTVERMAALLGVHPVPGGRHAEWSTRNALLGLGPDAYLELIGPDPEASPPSGPRPFELDDLAAPRLVTWAIRDAAPETTVVRAREAGVELGAVRTGSRLAPDGTRLWWRLTDPLLPRLGGVVPFLIDWGATPHPARSAPAGCGLQGLRCWHPTPARVAAVYRALGVELAVEPGPRPSLAASLLTPRGPVELS